MKSIIIWLSVGLVPAFLNASDGVVETKSVYPAALPSGPTTCVRQVLPTVLNLQTGERAVPFGNTVFGRLEGDPEEFTESQMAGLKQLSQLRLLFDQKRRELSDRQLQVSLYHSRPCWQKALCCPCQVWRIKKSLTAWRAKEQSELDYNNFHAALKVQLEQDGLHSDLVNCALKQVAWDGAILSRPVRHRNPFEMPRDSWQKQWIE